jgi:hypothetical protein
MSSPTPGSDPDRPHGAAPQSQPNRAAPQDQGYGGPAPSYPAGPAGYGGGAPAARPPQVMTAAVLGFVIALFCLIVALGAFTLSTLLGVFAVIGILFLGLTVVNIWGGALALMGKGSTVLKIAGLVTAGVAVLGFVLALTQASFSIWYLLLIVAGVAIYVLLNQPASREHFAARGVK